MSFEGPSELETLLLRGLPHTRIRLVAFGTPSPQGLVAIGRSVLDGVLDTMSPSDTVGPAGTAFAVVDEGLVIAPVTRERAPLSLVIRWVAGEAAALVPWDRVGELAATIERRGEQLTFVELPLSGKRTRVAFLDDAPGLPGNGAAGRALADAIEAASAGR
jgi:hypothetical protein